MRITVILCAAAALAVSFPGRLPGGELLPAYVPRAVAPVAGAGYVRRDGAIRIAAGNRGHANMSRFPPQ